MYNRGKYIFSRLIINITYKDLINCKIEKKSSIKVISILFLQLSKRHYGSMKLDYQIQSEETGSRDAICYSLSVRLSKWDIGK